MPNLLLKLNVLYNLFSEFYKSNPVVAGAVSLYGLGVATYVLRDVPAAIYRFIKTQLTTTLTVNNSDAIYLDLMMYVSKTKMHGFVRSLSFSNKSWDYDSPGSFISMGYGHQWFFTGRTLVSMWRVKDEAQQSFHVKEHVILTVFGRSHKSFNKLFEEIKKFKDQSVTTRVYMCKDGVWEQISSHTPRHIDTVILPHAQKHSLLTHIDKFFKNKDWCVKNGIPWRTGVLLSGPPGTGKTSIIKALCAYYEKDLYLIDLNRQNDKTLLEALAAVPERGIAVIEDIDVAGIPKRDGSKFEEKNKDDDDDEESRGVTLSGVLNAIDGPASGEGRVLIATSNNPDALDAALVRPGRFDLKLKIDYMNKETFEMYLSRFFPETKNELANWSIKSNIPVCEVQRLVLENPENPQFVLESIADKVC